jgi:hypothetical protein
MSKFDDGDIAARFLAVITETSGFIRRFMPDEFAIHREIALQRKALKDQSH